MSTPLECTGYYTFPVAATPSCFFLVYYILKNAFYALHYFSIIFLLLCLLGLCDIIRLLGYCCLVQERCYTAIDSKGILSFTIPNNVAPSPHFTVTNVSSNGYVVSLINRIIRSHSISVYGAQGPYYVSHFSIVQNTFVRVFVALRAAA